MTQTNNNDTIRLDKWLWAARFFKTRGLARDAIAAGKVLYNGQRCKPSRVVELHAKVKVPQGYDYLDITIEALKGQRLSAPLAKMMYQESQESEERRAKNTEARRLQVFHSPKPDHRPDKKQRRQIIQFKQQ
ncbi:MAG: heat-shock protein [Paraglaciecola sp.]|nr:heat-shock protein [Paraglaciecola sp.]NCT49835.1 heat-shock protein [Paraglaciecola sp.]